MLAADRDIDPRQPHADRQTRRPRSSRASSPRRAGSRTCSSRTPSEPAPAPGRHFSRRALQAALLINLYRDEPILHLPFRLLAVLADIERNFTTWRQRHAQMAMRMIGTRIGTGGTSGPSISTARPSVTASSRTSRRSRASTFRGRRFPMLPPDVRSRMGFRFTSP